MTHIGVSNTTECVRRLNKCGVISPRYDVRYGDIETWIGKLMPSRLVRTDVVFAVAL